MYEISPMLNKMLLISKKKSQISNDFCQFQLDLSIPNEILQIQTSKSKFEMKFFQFHRENFNFKWNFVNYFWKWLVCYEVEITPLLYFLVARKNGRITNVRFHVVCIFYTYTLKWPLFKMMNKLQMNYLNIALIFVVVMYLSFCKVVKKFPM